MVRGVAHHRPKPLQGFGGCCLAALPGGKCRHGIGPGHVVQCRFRGPGCHASPIQETWVKLLALKVQAVDAVGGDRADQRAAASEGSVAAIVQAAGILFVNERAVSAVGERRGQACRCIGDIGQVHSDGQRGAAKVVGVAGQGRAAGGVERDLVALRRTEVLDGAGVAGTVLIEHVRVGRRCCR